MRIVHIVGARPNLPKLAPVHRAAAVRGNSQIIVHTGQHYDEAMSEGFFRTLGIPRPNYNLEVGSASHAVQTARVMERIEPILIAERPDWLVLYGDVNSTVAAALVAAKLGIMIAHVEAGLRSNDRTMPEEINRIVTDRLADLLLTPSRDADATLLAEGEPTSEIVFVGNVMVDTLLYSLNQARQLRFLEHLGCIPGEPVLVTLHRPSNVDEPVRLSNIMEALRTIAEARPVIFPAHPRTAKRIKETSIPAGRVRLIPPVGYFEMISMIDTAHSVITDSGGVQEETTVLNIPCFTVRENTERPITISEGTNTLVPDPNALPDLVHAARRSEDCRRPEGWDGQAAIRIVEALAGGARM